MIDSTVQEYAKLIELPVQRKLLSLLEGRHGGVGAGTSHEFLDMAEYKVGDDIKWMDWKTTARLNYPVIKRFESTAILNVVLAVDTGSNMAALSSGRVDPELKQDVVEGIVAAMSWLTAQRGDHLALVAGDKSGVFSMPARSGLAHMQTIQRVATRATPDSAGRDFNAVLRRVNAVRRNRSLVVGITDLFGITEADLSHLKRLSYRHDATIFIVEDLDPTQYKHAQNLELVDVAAGPLPNFVSGNEVSDAIVAQWRSGQKRRRNWVAKTLKRYGISWVYVGSKWGIPDALIAAFGGDRRGTAFA